MHKLKSIRVEGFLGQKKDLSFDLSPEATFIIGRNGTGKTTLINLINSCMSADRDVLFDTNFSRVHFTFKKDKKRKIPHLTIDRKVEESGYKEIIYSFKESASAPADVHKIGTVRPRRISHAEVRRKISEARPSIYEIRHRLSTLFRHTWLSLQRGADLFEQEDFEVGITYTSGVDQKLEEVSNKLTRFFSRLDRQVAELTQSFQQDWFLSFLATEKNTDSVLISQVDLEEEKKAIIQIFDNFDVPRDTYAKQLDKHGRLAERAQQKLGGDERFDFEDFLIFYDVMKLHSLVEQWQTLQEQQIRIYKPKTDLLQIASKMLFRKRIEVSSSNELVVYSEKNDVIKLEKLSSGEKQLIIFLSETLLQNQKPYIFLADEPELSLHIEWQEQLVPSLLKINPSAQVIFATHSPDVVGKFQDNLINMEHLID